MKLEFNKSLNAFEKINNDYCVLLNIKHNALFLFQKDVKIIWDFLDRYNSFDKLYEEIRTSKYIVEEDELYLILEFLAKCGLVDCETIQEDLKFITENNHLDDYVDYCTTYSIPTILHMEITNKCNLKCVHCFHDEEYSNIDIIDVRKLFESLRNSPFVHVTLTGGEICLYPNWREIVSLAKKMD